MQYIVENEYELYDIMDWKNIEISTRRNFYVKIKNVQIY